MNADFMFKLNEQEAKELITNCDRFKTLKHSATTPNVFTEQIHQKYCIWREQTLVIFINICKKYVINT